MFQYQPTFIELGEESNSIVPYKEIAADPRSTGLKTPVNDRAEVHYITVIHITLETHLILIIGAGDRGD